MDSEAEQQIYLTHMKELDEIQELIDSDRANWIARTHGLSDAAQKLLVAIDAKDANAFLLAGGNLDRACESCHIDYWYKKTSAPARPI